MAKAKPNSGITLPALLQLRVPGNGAFASVLKGGSASLALPGPAEKPIVDTRRMVVTSVIATATQDRDGDIVIPSGADLTEHRINPVVMYHHGKDRNLPIGKAEDADGNYTVRLAGNRLVADTHFAQNDPFAASVFNLIDQDILRGTSVGFDPIECKALGPQPDEKTRPPLRFDRWRMFEYSHTPVGVNREALTVAVRKAKEGSVKLHPLLVQQLEPFALPRTTTVRVPALPTRVTKAMDDELDPNAAPPGADDIDPGTGQLTDEDADSGDTPPTAAAFYDFAQAIADAVAAFEAATAKSEHTPSHKMIDRTIADATSWQEELKAYGDKVSSSLERGGASESGDTSADMDVADEDIEPVEKAANGALIIKGYTPTRWGPLDLASAEVNDTIADLDSDPEVLAAERRADRKLRKALKLQRLMRENHKKAIR